MGVGAVEIGNRKLEVGMKLRLVEMVAMDEGKGISRSALRSTFSVTRDIRLVLLLRELNAVVSQAQGHL